MSGLPRHRRLGTQRHGAAQNIMDSLNSILIMNWKKLKKARVFPSTFSGASRSTLDRIGPIHCLETSLHSARLGIAGRVDCIAEFDGELAVIDFKTTKTLKKVEWLEKFFVQEAAYAYMYYELTGVEVDKLVTLSVAEDGQIQVEQRYDKIPYRNKLIDWIDSTLRQMIEDKVLGIPSST